MRTAHRACRPHDSGTTGHGDSSQFTIRFTNSAAVPEPLTLSLLGAGAIGLALRRRRRTVQPASSG